MFCRLESEMLGVVSLGSTTHFPLVVHSTTGAGQSDESTGAIYMCPKAEKAARGKERVGRWTTRLTIGC